MIEEIDRRLLAWAEYQFGGGVQMVGGYGSMMAAIASSQGVVIRSTVTEVYVADEVLSTADAVEKIGRDLRRVVDYHYLNNELSIEQKAARCCISQPTFYRWLHKAHEEVLYHLKPNKPLRTRTIGDRLAAEHRRVEMPVRGAGKSTLR